MNLVLDLGNTRIKAALFHASELVEKSTFPSTTALLSFLEQHQFEHAIVSSVNQSADEILRAVNVTGKKFKLKAAMPLPIKNHYATPDTLGVDRLAGACGAFHLFPNSDCLVVDAGTCINYEFINKHGHYLGGAISPGITMRFEAMHKFTARLPLVHFTIDTHVPMIGDSTETCMQSGVGNGVVAEVDGTIEKYITNYPDLVVILCGGDAALFENRLKHRIFVAPDLILKGLNSILLYNVSI
ncbi:MAG: type III pantothenate kinase [Cytophaga sp.]|nr:type III pantothenate kinase [Cytophaga sp.]